MKKLSELTKRENCFFTIDGKILKTIQDMLEYFVNCDEENYNHHVNATKNDFANWVNDVLLFPELAKSLKNAKTINESRDVLMEFFQVFDYRSKWISEEKVFHTVDGYKLKNIQELYYYLNNCTDGNFAYHVNDQKNDFANWVSDVLLFPSLAAKMRIVTSRMDMVTVLKEFLLKSTAYGVNLEYDRYIDERSIQEKLVREVSDQERSGSVSVEKTGAEKNIDKRKSDQELNVSSESKTPGMSGVSGLVEETIDLSVKPEIKVVEEQEKEPGPAFNDSGFRQFTDEELEKFTQFSRNEKTVESDLKVEYLKSALQELKNMVRDMRRGEKDPFIADLMLRTISSKIDYYAISKNTNDYNTIIHLMKDVQHEIEECSQHQSYNIAEEILKDLRLQGIAMKKA